MTPEILSKLENSSKAFYIDDIGEEYEISITEAIVKMAQEKYTVKFEGLEKQWPEFNEDPDDPCTVHCYVSPKGAASFPIHQDPYDVTIICIEGTKIMNVNNFDEVIREGYAITIPANIPHQGINDFYSITLSLGYE